jgi:hypothetical protein
LFSRFLGKNGFRAEQTNGLDFLPIHSVIPLFGFFGHDSVDVITILASAIKLLFTLGSLVLILE